MATVEPAANRSPPSSRQVTVVAGRLRVARQFGGDDAVVPEVLDRGDDGRNAAGVPAADSVRI